MNIKFAHRMKDYEAGIFQVLNEKKDEAERQEADDGDREEADSCADVE